MHLVFTIIEITRKAHLFLSNSANLILVNQAIKIVKCWLAAKSFIPQYYSTKNIQREPHQIHSYIVKSRRG